MKNQAEYEQLTFTGEVLEVLSIYSEKMKLYESEKAKLQQNCLTYEEYERRIRELIAVLGL